MTRSETGAPTSPWVVALIAGLFGGLLGALIPSLVRGDASPPPEIAGLDALERQVQELTQEIRSRPIAPSPLSQRPDADDAPRQSPVEPLVASPTADLQAMLARLDTLLGRLETVAATGTQPLTIPDPTVTAPALDALLTQRKNRKRSDSDQLPRELYFLNYQQVLDRYGQPQRILGGPMGTAWSYYDPGDPERRLTLIFVDGLLADWSLD